MIYKLTAHWLRWLARNNQLGTLGATLCETANDIDDFLSGYTNGYTSPDFEPEK